MRKSVVFFALFSLFFAVLCFDVSAAQTVDIGLAYGSGAKASVTISTSFGTGTITAAEVDSEKTFYSDDFVYVDGKAYRGTVIVRKNSSGLLTVVNRVDLEDYVASVVSNEMSPSFNTEALKAQAVCARTYAIKNLGKHKAYGFDLCASVDCQAYGGVSSESSAAVSAASATKGLVMRYNGSVIDAVYSATSGGWTEDAKNVWGSDIPYLVAAEDSYESKSVYASSWTKEITVERATEIMNSKGYNLGTVTSVTVEEQTERGVVTKLKVTGTNGEKTFTREGCRLAFGSVTPSQAFTVTANTEGAVAADPLYAYQNTKLSNSVSVISDSGVTSRSLDGAYIKGTATREYKSVISSGEVTSFTFSGRGNGHLVGMSQNGANGMAAAGFTYDQILKHYYKGIEIS